VAAGAAAGAGAFFLAAWICAFAFVNAEPTQGKSTRHIMFAAIQAAEQFFPLVHRLRLPPTAFRFAAAIRLSLGYNPFAKSKTLRGILCD
jgi:hypothetical protein